MFCKEMTPKEIKGVLGMAVVDLQRFDRNKRKGFVERVLFLSDVNEDCPDDIDIRTMANLISKPLTSGKFKYRDAPQPSARTNDTNKPLVRITDGEDGSYNYASGKPRTNSCYICRQYMQKGKNTVWQCRDCGMPICQKSRCDAYRKETCLEEHKASEDEYLGCKKGGLKNRKAFAFPDHLKKVKWTRSVCAKKAAATKKRKEVDSSVTPSPTKRSKRS